VTLYNVSSPTNKPYQAEPIKCMKCPEEPHYQLVDWEVTGCTQVGLPIQTLFANCFKCGMKTAIKVSMALEA